MRFCDFIKRSQHFFLHCYHAVVAYVSLQSFMSKKQVPLTAIGIEAHRRLPVLRADFSGPCSALRSSWEFIFFVPAELRPATVSILVSLISSHPCPSPGPPPSPTPRDNRLHTHTHACTHARMHTYIPTHTLKTTFCFRPLNLPENNRIT